MVLIKYNAGNIQSVSFALERLGVDFTISDDPETITKADKVIFPGVGEASTTMAYLRDRKLDQVIKNLKQPVLGICLGMQLMCRHSEENDTECLGIFDQPVKRFVPKADFKVPHMGWNTVEAPSDSVLFEGLGDQRFYFVHSYAAASLDLADAGTAAVRPPLLTWTEYGARFLSAVENGPLKATQFHPEKSGAAGVQLLRNWLATL